MAHYENVCTEVCDPRGTKTQRVLCQQSINEKKKLEALYASTAHDIQLALTEKAKLIIKKDILPAIDPATRRWMCPEIPICLLSSCKRDIISISGEEAKVNS